VIVNGRHLEPARKQSGHHGGHLLVEQNQVAHDHRLLTDLLEGGVGAEGETRLHGDALHRHRQIGARHPDAKHVTRLELTGLPERLLDPFPVWFGRTRSCRRA
jgi:hypothetical protein